MRRGGPSLGGAELGAILQCADTHSTNRSQIVAILTAIVTKTSPIEIRVHDEILVAMQVLCNSLETYASVNILAEILLSWAFQAPLSSCILQQNVPMDQALSQLNGIFNTFTSLQVSQARRFTCGRCLFLLCCIEQLRVNIQRVSSTCVAMVQLKYAFVCISVLRRLDLNPLEPNGETLGVIEHLATLMSELLFMASSVRIVLRSAGGKSRKRRRHKHRRENSTDSSSSEASSSHSDSDAVSEQDHVREVSTTNVNPLLIEARAFANSLALYRTAMQRPRTESNGFPIESSMSQLSTVVESALVAGPPRICAALMKQLIFRSCCELAKVLASEMPVLPQPRWAGGSLSSFSAFADAAEFHRRGRRWRALRRFIAQCAVSSSFTKQVGEYLFVLVRDAALYLSHAQQHFANEPSYTCGELLCYLEALAGFTSHVRCSNDELAVIAVQSLMSLMQNMYKLRISSNDNSEDTFSMDFSTLPVFGSPQDDQGACAIRLVAATLGYIVVHRVSVVTEHYATRGLLCMLLQATGFESSRLAFLHLLHPVIAVYIVAYVLPRLDIYTDKSLLSAADQGLAVDAAGSDFARIDLSAAFGFYSHPCVSQWPPGLDDDRKDPITEFSTIRQIKMPNLHLLSAGDVVRLKLSISMSFPSSRSTDIHHLLQPKQPYVFILPSSVLYEVLKYLSARQLCRFAQTSHALRRLSLHEDLWYSLYQSRFPSAYFVGYKSQDSAVIPDVSPARASDATTRVRIRSAQRNNVFLPRVSTSHSYAFNRDAACVNCFSSKVMQGSGVHAAAVAELERTYLIPLPRRRNQKHACLSPDVRHDWRALFVARWLAVQTSKARMKRGNVKHVRVCPAIGCTMLFSSKDALESHIHAQHNLMQNVPWKRKDRSRVKRVSDYLRINTMQAS